MATPEVQLIQSELAIDYTNLDFISMVAELRTLVLNRFPHLTNVNPGSTTQMMIELVSAAGDRVTYMQDKQADEAFIVTARRRVNIIAHAKGLSYTITTQKAATGTIRASIKDGTPRAENIEIPEGTIITSKEVDSPVEFRTTQDAILLAGQLFVDIPIKNSEVQDQSFESDGTANQVFELDFAPFLDDDSIYLEIDGEEWDQVENFLSSTATDKHFRIGINEDDFAEIIFSDGTNGAIPGSGKIIDVIYETGGGSVGNQVADAIQINEDDFFTTVGDPVNLEFTNPAATEGGDDRETNDQIKIRAPRSVKTNKRTIAREDFTINPEDNVAGVLRAIGFSINENALIDENTVYVHIVPEDQTDPGLPTTTLKDNVHTFLTTIPPDGMPVPITMDVFVVDPIYLPVTIEAKVYIDGDEDFDAVKQNVIDNLNTFFDFNTFEANKVDRTMDWGKKVRWSRVVKEINKVKGVNYVSEFELNGLGFEADVEPTFEEMPRLDDSNFDTVGGLEFLID